MRRRLRFEKQAAMAGVLCSDDQSTWRLRLDHSEIDSESMEEDDSHQDVQDRQIRHSAIFNHPIRRHCDA